MKTTRTLVFVALLIAMDIVLTRLLAVQTPFIRVSFGFLAIAFSSILFGPYVAGLGAMFADILGFFTFGVGNYFPGFTLSALLTGIIYGFYLHNRPITLKRVILAAITITVIVDIGLNTLWLSMLYKEAFTTLVGIRIIQKGLFLPIQVAMIYTLWRYAGSYIRATYFRKNKTV